MAKTFTTWGTLEQEIQEKMNRAVKTAAVNSYVDLKQNVSHFYDMPGGRYNRTGQLADAPEIEIRPGGNISQAEIALDTGKQYTPAGITTLDIYNLAESGYLLGIPEFWLRTKRQMKKHTYDAFSREF